MRERDTPVMRTRAAFSISVGSAGRGWGVRSARVGRYGSEQVAFGPCLRGEAARTGAEAGTGRGLTWVVEMLDEPVLENGQCFGAEVALLPPVES